MFVSFGLGIYVISERGRLSPDQQALIIHNVGDFNIHSSLHSWVECICVVSKESEWKQS